jgi:hypothetical protein
MTRVGVWLVATAALGRDVPVDERPHPHVCGMTVAGRHGRERVLYRRDCAACADDEQRGERAQ